MLYKLTLDNEKPHRLEPMPFYDFSELNLLEKDLENLIKDNLLNKLFEDNALLPIHQSRSYQGEADIYAVTENGDLVIFELKRGIADNDAMIQILGYAQKAGQWGYDKLNSYFKANNQGRELLEAHKEAFQLDNPLNRNDFNRNQHLYVVGSATNEAIVKSLAYWKSKGLSVEFIPYRIYKLENELLFEFFAKPNDIHTNPNQQKGAILDTNRTTNDDCVWDMLTENKAAAYGGQAYFAHYLKKGDKVFLSHKNQGIIAAGEVLSNAKDQYNSKLKDNESFVNIKWLTKTPTKDEGIIKYMPFSNVRELLGHGFFWARTIKTPYLTKDEASLLVEELKKVLL